MKRKRKLNLLLAVLLAIVQIVQISGPLGVRAAEADRNSEGDDFTGIYSEKYFEPSKSNRNWCEGMVSGNGKNGVITSGAPYSDTLIYQNMMFNMPNNNYREVLPGIEDDLEKARAAVINRDTSWNYDGQERQRYYTFHPGHQLRITMEEIPYENYRRWTNYETAEVGVSYTDRYGEWERTTFTSRADDVTITRIQQSSDNRKVSLTLSIDNISDLRGFGSGPEGAYERYIEYKKIVDDDLNYIAQVAHYPVTDRGTEFNEAGYAGMTQVITIGGEKEKVILDGEKDSQNAGEDANPGIKIIGADAVYLITKSARTFDMGKMEDFAENENYEIVDRLYEETNQAAGKYMKDGNFDYNAALQAHVELHKPQFDAVKLDLKSSESDRNLSTEELLEKQKNTNGLNEAFVERAYYAGRYAQLCCSGYSTSRLGGMWTGEWNSPWGGLYTTDANVNIQVSAMNTANMAYTPIGYISFILRQAGDWLTNAEVVYGMHDAIQAPHNTDGDCAVMIQSDAAYPMQYWNAGASWLLLPIYEYWQCYGNQQIPIPEDVDLYEIKGVLGTEDGGLSDEEVSVIIERGYLDLEKDILLPLLTKLCNFWQQLCTPEYYTDVEGEHRYEKGKKGLEEGERYVLIPTYSPENAPKGSYNKPTTLNATMDIAAARDSLDMASAVEKAVNGENGSEQIKVWQDLKSKLPEYQLDGEPGSKETNTGGGGALREWSTHWYTENNSHRHISHLYAAWPAYDTKNDPELEKAAQQALNNRIRLNTGGDSTTGHGWMHQALVAARLGDEETAASNMEHLMSSNIYFTSMMTDHNTNRGSGAYCTDTCIGITGLINESLVFSNTGEIEILPALFADWKSGSVSGLRARTQVEIDRLSWDLERGTVNVDIISDIDQTLTLTSGRLWNGAKADGAEAEIVEDAQKIILKIKAGQKVSVTFYLFEADKETLLAKITEAESELTEKEAPVYPLSDEEVNLALRDAIGKAEKVYSSETAGENEIRNSVISLNDALIVFRKAYEDSFSFSLTPGIYEDEKKVDLQYKADDRVEVHYTTDGTKPTIDSPVYNGAIPIQAGVTHLRAQRFIKASGEEWLEPLIGDYFCISGSNLAMGKKASTTNTIYSGQGADKAVNGNSSDRFSIRGNTNPQILEVDFGTEVTFDMILLDEFTEGQSKDEPYRIQSYKLLYDKDGKWEEAYVFDTDEPKVSDFVQRDYDLNPEKHAYLGACLDRITTSKVRLEMVADIEISLWEFQVYKTNIKVNEADVRYFLNGRINNICDTDTMNRLGRETSEGVHVISAGRNTLAGEAGLEPDDVITSLNGQKTDNVESFCRIYGQIEDNTQVILTVERKGETKKVSYLKTEYDLSLRFPETVEAEDSTEISGDAKVGFDGERKIVTDISRGDYLIYRDVSFEKTPKKWFVSALVPEGKEGVLTIRTDNWEGETAAEILLTDTDGEYMEFNAPNSLETLSGEHDIYIELPQGVSIDWFACSELLSEALFDLLEKYAVIESIDYTKDSYEKFHSVYEQAEMLTSQVEYTEEEAEKMAEQLGLAAAALIPRGSDTLYVRNVYRYAQSVLDSELADIIPAKKQRIREKAEDLYECLGLYDNDPSADIEETASQVLNAVAAVSTLSESEFIDDTDSRIVKGSEKGTWGSYSNSKYNGGSISTFKVADGKGYTELTFTGERVAFWTELAVAGVINELWIDGEKIDERDAQLDGNGVVDTLFDTRDYDFILDEGEHTIRIVAGEISPNSGSYNFRVDGFEVWKTGEYIVDSKELLQIVSQAESLISEDYTEESFAAMQEKLAEAEKELYSISTDQDRKDAAAEALRQAVEALVPKLDEGEKVSKKTLEYFLNKAKEYVSAGEVDSCVETVRNLFTEAITEGSEVMADEDATREEVMKASLKLMKAIHALNIKTVDKTDLEMAVELGKMIDLNKYVEAGQKEFTEALEAAKEVLADGNAVQDEVDAAWNALIEAIENLRLKADKNVLEELLAEMEDLDLGRYTEESASMFRTAFASAQSVYADETLCEKDQQKVDAAVAALQKAKENLSVKEEETEKENAGAEEREEEINSSPENEKGEAFENPGLPETTGNDGKNDGISSAKAAKTVDKATFAGWLMLVFLSGTAILTVCRRRV